MSLKARLARVQQRFQERLHADFEAWTATLTPEQAGDILAFVDCWDSQGMEAARSLSEGEPEWLPVLLRFAEMGRI